jgi:hypothetical protein
VTAPSAAKGPPVPGGKRLCEGRKGTIRPPGLQLRSTNKMLANAVYVEKDEQRHSGTRWVDKLTTAAVAGCALIGQALAGPDDLNETIQLI